MDYPLPSLQKKWELESVDCPSLHHSSSYLMWIFLASSTAQKLELQGMHCPCLPDTGCRQRECIVLLLVLQRQVLLIMWIVPACSIISSCILAAVGNGFSCLPSSSSWMQLTVRPSSSNFLVSALLLYVVKQWSSTSYKEWIVPACCTAVAGLSKWTSRCDWTCT
jgi:hypothetical protein